jgi:HSP20 family protein
MSMPEQEQNVARPQGSDQGYGNESRSEGSERSERRAALERAAYEPFSALGAFSSDMNRWFDRMVANFFGPSLFPWANWSDTASRSMGVGPRAFWPQLEVQHRGDKLAVRIDLPGLQKDDIAVEVRGNELSISGQRRSQAEHREGRYYRAERSYGSFCRNLRLPDGAKPDTASANFENGVLEIEMDAPGGEQGQTRRIEVREGTLH